MSQVGWRLIVASSAKISRPRPLDDRRRRALRRFDEGVDRRAALAARRRGAILLAHAKHSPGAKAPSLKIGRGAPRRKAEARPPYSSPSSPSVRRSFSGIAAAPAPAAARSSGASFAAK